MLRLRHIACQVCLACLVYLQSLRRPHIYRSPNMRFVPRQTKFYTRVHAMEEGQRLEPGRLFLYGNLFGSDFFHGPQPLSIRLARQWL